MFFLQILMPPGLYPKEQKQERDVLQEREGAIFQVLSTSSNQFLDLSRSISIYFGPSYSSSGYLRLSLTVLSWPILDYPLALSQVISDYLWITPAILLSYLWLSWSISGYFSIFGYLRLSWTILGNIRLYRPISVYLGLSLAISCYLWLSPVISCYLRLSLAVPGYL